MRLLLVTLALICSSGCIVVRPGSRYPYPDQPPASYPPPNNPPPATYPPPQRPPPGHGGGYGGSQELRIKEIKAQRVSARVIYAKEIKARDGRIGRVIHVDGRPPGAGQGELKVPDVHADVIHAVEIKCDWIEADEVYAKEVKLGR